MTFAINTTLDGCVDHCEGIVDDEPQAILTQLLDQAGAMLWGRATDERMERHWWGC